VKAGRIRPLGVTSLKRVPTLPQVPTIAESGLPGFEDNQWQGVVGPAGLPRSVVVKLNAAIGKVLAETDVRDRLAGMSAEAVASTPEQLDDFIKVQIARWSKVITAGMRID